MLFECFKWLVALLSLSGVVLNVRHDRRCFWCWSFSNAAWTAVDVWHQVYAQAALQAVYFVLAIWGLMAWRRTDAQSETSPH